MDLNLGDEVFIQGFGGVDLRKSKITRLTKTSVFVESPNTPLDKFSRTTMSKRIDSWTWLHLKPSTPELERQYQRQQQIRKTSDLIYALEKNCTKKTMSDLPDDTITEIYTTLSKAHGLIKMALATGTIQDHEESINE